MKEFYKIEADKKEKIMSEIGNVIADFIKLVDKQFLKQI